MFHQNKYSSWVCQLACTARHYVTKTGKTDSTILTCCECSHFSPKSIGAFQSKNYYDILKVSSNCDSKGIKEAFYEQSKKLHPDKRPDNENAPAEFKALVEAYEVLNDASKRKEYDEMIGIRKQDRTKSPYNQGNIFNSYLLTMTQGIVFSLKASQARDILQDMELTPQYIEKLK